MTGRGALYYLIMAGDRKNASCIAYLGIFFFLLTSFNLSAQEKYDLGIFAGTSYYMGDLNSSVHYAMPSIAIGPVYRYNFNFRNSIRAHAIYHGLNGDNSEYSGYILDGGGTFFNSKFVDLGLDFEFNWKAYKTAFRKTKSSPYVFAGIGYGLDLSISDSHVNIPFGIGYKVNMGRWLSAGFEASGRKTFTDRIDGASNPPLENAIAPFGNRDWYFFTGVFVTYKFFKFWDDCPTYD
jgi:hypothetical protein